MQLASDDEATCYQVTETLSKQSCNVITSRHRIRLPLATKIGNFHKPCSLASKNSEHSLGQENVHSNMQIQQTCEVLDTHEEAFADSKKRRLFRAREPNPFLTNSTVKRSLEADLDHM